MLRNRFRRFMGYVIVLFFAIAVYQYSRMVGGNEYVVDALLSGFLLLFFLALILWIVYRIDRRIGKRSE